MPPPGRFKGAYLTSDKSQFILIAWGGDWKGTSIADWSYDKDGEDAIEATNNYRFFPSVDSGVRFGRPDMYGRRLTGSNLIVNRCQKPLELWR